MSTTTIPKMTGGMASEEFDALALLNVYFFADLAYPGVREGSERRKLFGILRKGGHLLDVEGGVEEAANEVWKAYEDAIEKHAAENLPEDYHSRHDYWGAKCFHRSQEWNSPKDGGVFTGDSSGKYETFASAEALWEETQRIHERYQEV